MLPFNRFFERDLHIKYQKTWLSILLHIGPATGVSLNSKYNKKNMNLEIIKKTYKLLRVGGKVNGMAPPIWLSLRSLCNCKTENLMRFLFWWK